MASGADKALECCFLLGDRSIIRALPKDFLLTSVSLLPTSPLPQCSWTPRETNSAYRILHSWSWSLRCQMSRLEVSKKGSSAEKQVYINPGKMHVSGIGIDLVKKHTNQIHHHPDIVCLEREARFTSGVRPCQSRFKDTLRS